MPASRTPVATTTARHLGPRLATFLAVLVVLSSSAVADCPDADIAAPLDDSPQSTPPAASPAAMEVDPDIHLEMDSFDATREGTWHLNGDVTISQGDRQLKTSDATYDPASQSFATENGVEYSDPQLKVRGSAAQFDPAGGAIFAGAEFELPTRPARGAAQRIKATAEGDLSLDGVRYTTCPLGQDDWVLRASDIDINQRAGIGTGRNVRLDFYGIPILYTPFISFPVSAARKSGFLFPTFGSSSRSGTTLELPWYWNIAPHYDATFLPTWYSTRGGRLATEFRYLSPYGRGAFDADYLPHDDQFGSSRTLLRFVDQSDFTEQWRLGIEAAEASDNQWFEDFGLGPEGTSVSYLNRVANLTYLGDHWFASARAQNFQTIDATIDVVDRPYTILPQLAVQALIPTKSYGLTLGFDGELSNFLRDDGVTGVRLDVMPEVRMPLRGAGIYLEPRAAWRYTAYDLDDTGAGADVTPDRSLPVLSLDGGMTFERNWGSKGQRLQTIEPRFMYLYVPYRNQDDLPVFDSGLADVNLVQLFRNNRYVGADRLSNANQISVGLTSRLLEADTGEQFIAATIGQAYYFDKPRVLLPGEPATDSQSSDIVAEFKLTAYRNWNVSMGVQWDPAAASSEKSDINFQYQPDYERVMNLGYRFRRDLEQVDGSIAWPFGKSWGGYARMVYSLEEKTALDQFVGVEYRACCWRVRLVTRRYVSSREGDIDNSILLQLELNGLSSVGVGADAFLERAIRGYSFSPPTM